MPRRLPLALLALTLSACAHHRVAVEAPPLPPVAVVEPPAPPPPVPRGPTPINAHLSPAATVWHLRAGLNVAALACRGADEQAIIAGYNALLSSQKAGFTVAQASLAAEYRAGGGDWQDRQDDAMTRLYNFWSQAPARDAFCAAAVRVLADSATVAPADLVTFAGARLVEIDAPFAALLPAPVPQPVMAVAAAPAAAPPAAMALARAAGPAPAAPAPRLTLDLGTLTADPRH